MKRILIVTVALFTLGLLLSGCAQAKSGSKTPESVQPFQQVAPKQGGKEQKPTPAEVDAQAEKIQNEIDSLLTDLNNDTDEQNINSEAK